MKMFSHAGIGLVLTKFQCICNSCAEPHKGPEDQPLHPLFCCLIAHGEDYSPSKECSIHFFY